MSDKMFECLFQLKFQSKQLARAAKKEEKKASQARKKVADALRKGQREKAEIFAKDALRCRAQGNQYLRMSAQLDGVRSRVEAAQAERQLVKTMPGLVKSLDKAMGSMDLRQLTAVMDKFGEQFDDLEVQGETVAEALGGATQSLTPEDDVSALIAQTADEHALNLTELLPGFVRAEPQAAPAQQESSSSKQPERQRVVL